MSFVKAYLFHFFYLTKKLEKEYTNKNINYVNIRYWNKFAVIRDKFYFNFSFAKIR